MGEIMEPILEKKSWWVIDIETVSNESSKEYTKKIKFKAPSNYKDEEKIAAYIDQEKEKAEKNYGLSWWTGKVCLVSLKNYETGSFKDFYNHKEEVILIELKKFLTDELLSSGQTYLIGKSSVTFDFPFLKMRYVVNKIKIPTILIMQNLCLDIDKLISNYSSCNQVSTLDNYAFGLGIMGKIGSGSQVQDMYNMTLCDPMHWKELIDYCHQDCEIVHKFLKAFYLED